MYRVWVSTIYDIHVMKAAESISVTSITYTSPVVQQHEMDYWDKTSRIKLTPHVTLVVTSERVIFYY